MNSVGNSAWFQQWINGDSTVEASRAQGTVFRSASIMGTLGRVCLSIWFGQDAGFSLSKDRTAHSPNMLKGQSWIKGCDWECWCCRHVICQMSSDKQVFPLKPRIQDHAHIDTDIEPCYMESFLKAMAACVADRSADKGTIGEAPFPASICDRPQRVAIQDSHWF